MEHLPQNALKELSFLETRRNGQKLWDMNQLTVESDSWFSIGKVFLPKKGMDGCPFFRNAVTWFVGFLHDWMDIRLLDDPCCPPACLSWLKKQSERTAS